jgi:alpha-L-arabinofuranosidase
VRLLHSLGAITLAAVPCVALAQGCGVVAPQSGGDAAVTVRGSQVLRPATAPLLQGFNLEWTTFQSEFWDTRTGALQPDLVRLMSAFPGAVYRFPGGTVSNYLDLAASLGPMERRSAQRSVEWTGPEPMRFGLQEYYDFVAAVKGQPWLVLNPYGRIDGARQPGEMASTWAAVVDFAASRQPPLRYELGNEPFLPRYRLTASEYSQRAQAVVDAIGAKVGSGRFVAAAADIDTPRQRKAEYNKDLAAGVGRSVTEFAQHNYYDGPPGGPTVPNRLTSLCSTLEQAKRDGVREPVLWVTEHARWPGGRATDKNWKDLWPKTNNLEAGLGVADYLIGISQMGSVRGAFLHSLSGSKGPWALLLRGRGDELVPTALYRVLEVLTPLSTAGDVRAVEIRSPRNSGYPGGYDMRASALRDAASGAWTVVAINRSDRALPTRIVVQDLAGASGPAAHRFVTASTLDANNSAERPDAVVVRSAQPALTFDAAGATQIELPPYSVNVVRLPARRS